MSIEIRRNPISKTPNCPINSYDRLKIDCATHYRANRYIFTTAWLVAISNILKERFRIARADPMGFGIPNNGDVLPICLLFPHARGKFPRTPGAKRPHRWAAGAGFNTPASQPFPPRRGRAVGISREPRGEFSSPLFISKRGKHLH